MLLLNAGSKNAHERDRSMKTRTLQSFMGAGTETTEQGSPPHVDTIGICFEQLLKILIGVDGEGKYKKAM